MLIYCLRTDIYMTLTKDNDYDSINRRLDAIIMILLNHTSIQESKLKQKVILLSSLGFENSEIAKILNTTTSLVAKEKSITKKGSKNE
jgi:hypothetical protein